MKKIYYYSNRKLNFIVINYFWLKLVGSICLVSLVASLLLWRGVTVAFLNDKKTIEECKSDSAHYVNNISDILVKFELLDNKLNNLALSNNDMCIKLNKKSFYNLFDSIGTGGGVFNNYLEHSEDILNSSSLIQDNIQSKLEIGKINFKELENRINYFEKYSESIPAIKPIVEGRYGSMFGGRMHPLLGYMRMHTGIDIITDMNTPVYATGKGKVSFVGYRNGYGLTVEIDHGFGYSTLFAHLNSALIKEGVKINRGDKIALSGNSGSLTTGPHLHYEVLFHKIPVNPIEYITEEFTTKEFLLSRDKKTLGDKI